MFSAQMGNDASKNSPLFELARVLVRPNHIARIIVNADHSIIALEIEQRNIER
jgi:hypothetical protein